jgi:hypothetical protein
MGIQSISHSRHGTRETLDILDPLLWWTQGMLADETSKGTVQAQDVRHCPSDLEIRC